MKKTITVTNCADCLFYNRPYCDLSGEEVIVNVAIESYPDKCPLLNTQIVVELKKHA